VLDSLISYWIVAQRVSLFTQRTKVVSEGHFLDLQGLDSTAPELSRRHGDLAGDGGRWHFRCRRPEDAPFESLSSCFRVVNDGGDDRTISLAL